MAKYRITVENLTENTVANKYECNGYVVGAFNRGELDIGIHDICDSDIRGMLRNATPFRKNVAALAGETLASLIEVVLEPDDEIKLNEKNAEPIEEDEEDAAD